MKLNLEMAAEEEIIGIALETLPDQCTLVPEKRQEITTEGGLDVLGQEDRIAPACRRLQDAGMEVSLFVDPVAAQIAAAAAVGADAVELHTGAYADAVSEEDTDREFAALVAAAESTREAGLVLHMGHGLTYRNVSRIAAIPGICEFNIGHSIIARAVLVGLERAVREMKALVR